MVQISGRDYVEAAMLPNSVPVFMALAKSDLIDETSIDNERLFQHRFGRYMTRTVRAKIIAIKSDYCLSDRQLWWLIRSAHIRLTRTSAEIKPDKWALGIGWFYVSLLVCYGLLGCYLLSITPQHIPPWRQTAGVLTMCITFIGGGWLIERVFIAPWRWVTYKS